MIRPLAVPAAALLLIGGAAAFSYSPSLSAGDSSSTPIAADSTDQDVVNFLIGANQEEISQARNALGTSQNPDVRKFAQMMITDHGRALSKVQAIGKRLGYAISDELPVLPAVPPPPRDSTGSDSNTTANLPYPRNADSAAVKGAGASGNDAEYIGSQVTAHQQVLEKLRAVSIGIKDSELRKHVADVQETVQAHLKEAKKVRSRLEKMS